MELAGKELFVGGAEVMVDVVVEGQWGEVKGVEPLEEGKASREFQVEDGSKNGAVGDGAGGWSMGENVGSVHGGGGGEMIGGLAVGAEKE